jgi:hypothetical protein
MNNKVKKLYDDIINEMTVAGAAGGAPDATSQGVFVWNKKGKGHSVRKSSPELEEAYGGGFGGMAATNSGNSHQGYTGDFDKKVKNKIKELKKKESLEESFQSFLESNAQQQEMIKQAMALLAQGKKEEAEALYQKALELGKELLNKNKQ